MLSAPFVCHPNHVRKSLCRGFILYYKKYIITYSKRKKYRENKNTETYELVAELDTWELDVPVSRFIEKVTQQYARMTVHGTIKEEGFEVAEEWEMDDNSIELTVTRWI